MTAPIPTLPPSSKATTWRDRLRHGVKRHRIRLSMYFAFLVSFASLVVLSANKSRLAWGFFAPYTFPLYFFLSDYRLKHHLTWRQAIGRFVGWCFVFGSLGLALVGFVELAEGMTPYWHIVLPILLVVGLYAAYLGLGLLVLYLAVRVVRAAWKRP